MWKSGLKTEGHHAIFWVLEVKKMKNITKIEHMSMFLFTLLVSFFIAFLAQKLIYAINKWFNFVPGSFFWARSSIKLNYFRSLCEKMTWMCTYFKTETDVVQNLIHDFFLTFTVRRPFHRKDFKWKKNMRVRGYFLKKRKLCMQNSTK